MAATTAVGKRDDSSSHGPIGAPPLQEVLLRLRPFLDFQSLFKARHGRRATDEEVPASLAPLAELYRTHASSLSLLPPRRKKKGEEAVNHGENGRDGKVMVVALRFILVLDRWFAVPLPHKAVRPSFCFRPCRVSLPSRHSQEVSPH